MNSHALRQKTWLQMFQWAFVGSDCHLIDRICRGVLLAPKIYLYLTMAITVYCTWYSVRFEASVALSPASKYVDSPQKFNIKCSDPKKEHIIWYIHQKPIWLIYFKNMCFMLLIVEYNCAYMHAFTPPCLFSSYYVWAVRSRDVVHTDTYMFRSFITTVRTGLFFGQLQNRFGTMWSP